MRVNGRHETVDGYWSLEFADVLEVDKVLTAAGRRISRVLRDAFSNWDKSPECEFSGNNLNLGRCSKEELDEVEAILKKKPRCGFESSFDPRLRVLTVSCSLPFISEDLEHFRSWSGVLQVSYALPPLLYSIEMVLRVGAGDAYIKGAVSAWMDT